MSKSTSTASRSQVKRDIAAEIHKTLYGESNTPQGKPERWVTGYHYVLRHGEDCALPYELHKTMSDRDWATWKAGYWAARNRLTYSAK